MDHKSSFIVSPYTHGEDLSKVIGCLQRYPLQMSNVQLHVHSFKSVAAPGFGTLAVPLLELGGSQGDSTLSR